MTGGKWLGGNDLGEVNVHPKHHDTVIYSKSLYNKATIRKHRYCISNQYHEYVLHLFCDILCEAHIFCYKSYLQSRSTLLGVRHIWHNLAHTGKRNKFICFKECEFDSSHTMFIFIRFQVCINRHHIICKRKKLYDNTWRYSFLSFYCTRPLSIENNILNNIEWY